MPGTTPVYGFPYPEPTDLVADYPALGQDLAEDIEAVLPTIAGLVPITPTSIANSGGTASISAQTVTFSAVNSVSLNGIFSATYRRYAIELNAKNSTSAEVRFRLRASGTDSSANSYYQTLAFSYGTTAGASSGTATYVGIYLGTSGSATDIARVIFDAPFSNSEWTQGFIDSWSYQQDVANFVQRRSGHNFQATTSFDGISVYPASGTFTGQLRIYGFKGA